MDLILTDLIGGIVEADNDVEAAEMIRPGMRFYAFFCVDGRDEEQWAYLYVMWQTNPPMRWPVMMFLCTQFPSLEPVASASEWAMNKKDYAKMRLFFGGRGWA